MKKIAHTLSIEDIIQELDVSLKEGLSKKLVLERQQEHGTNSITEEKAESLLMKVVQQLKSPLVYILLIASVVTFYLHEYLNAIVIMIAIVMNVAVGLIQEGRAGKAFKALDQSQQMFVFVRRDGKRQRIESKELVPGDIVFLEAGLIVPADLRLVQNNRLLINESALTGESMPQHKDLHVMDVDTSVSDRKNMTWMGTVVESGEGEGIVIAIGDETEMGLIARAIHSIENVQTPIQQNISRIARYLLIAVLVASVALFALGMAQGVPMRELFLIVVAVAVSVIPEGLPAAVTVVLAIGMERILKQGGLVRNLMAAETLGSTTYILTDKTGTLTQGVLMPEYFLTLESLETSLDRQNEVTTVSQKDLMRQSYFASTAKQVFQDDGTSLWQGDPLDAALTSHWIQNNDKESPELTTTLAIPFDARYRFSGRLDASEDLYLKGAPEVLLSQTDTVRWAGKESEMTDAHRAKFTNVMEKLSHGGYRVLAIAQKKIATDIPEEITTDLIQGSVFLGLVAFKDPLRGGIVSRIAEVADAGIKLIMVTGDHPETAKTIATEAGIHTEGDGILTGTRIAEMTDEELTKALKTTTVIARVLPDQKMRIATLLQAQGEIIAMTGDGVNDAPALQAAHIGIAVGDGTEVAKDSADLILLDNNFSVISSAIKEGRRIVDNLRKIVGYMLATNFGEIFLLAAALAFSLPMPFLPAQILWINIVGEGFMNFALAFEPAEDGVMKRSPSAMSSKVILTPKILKLIAIVGAVTGTFLMILYLFLTSIDMPIETIRTILFFSLAFDSLLFVFSFKNLSQPIWEENPFSNLYLLGAVGVSSLLLFSTLFIPPLRTLLSLTPIGWLEILILIGVAIVNHVVIEVAKYILFERHHGEEWREEKEV